MKRLPLIVFLLLAFMFVVAVFSRPPQPSPKQQVMAPTQVELAPNVPQTAIWIEPTPVAKVSEDGTVPLEFYIMSKQNQITRVQLELSYDPKVLQYVSIKGADYFGGKPVLEKKIDTVNGRITFAVGLGPKDIPIQGTDAIAELTFRPVALNGQKTEVKLLPESSAMAVGTDKSVLTDVKGTWVLFSKGEQKGE